MKNDCSLSRPKIAAAIAIIGNFTDAARKTGLARATLYRAASGSPIDLETAKTLASGDIKLALELYNESRGIAGEVVLDESA